jgi:hypothetical protein
MTRGGKRKGAGRKPAPPRKAFTVRLDAEAASRFTLYCQLAKLTQSAAVARLVMEARVPVGIDESPTFIQLP